MKARPASRTSAARRLLIRRRRGILHGVAGAHAHAAHRRVATAGLSTFLAVLIAEHVLRGSLSPSQHQISEYANGRAGWLMTLGFAAWTLSLVSTAMLVGSISRAPALGFGCAAAGMLLVTCFHTQTSAGVLPPDVARTSEGRLHDLGGEIASTGLILAAFAVSLTTRLPNTTRARAAGAAAFAVAVSVVLLTFAPHAGGARQRATVLTACLWQATILGSGFKVLQREKAPRRAG
jgi:hypothetical protein